MQRRSGRQDYSLVLGSAALARPWALLTTLGLFAIVEVGSAGSTLSLATCLSGLALTFIVYGGFAINDYFDQDLDRLVHPERVIPRGLLKPETALYLAIAAFVVGLFLTALVGPTHLAISSVAILLLVAYSPMKAIHGLLGNVIIAAIVALVVVFGSLSSPNLNSIEILLLSLAVFFAMLAQEPIKDIEDMQAERDKRKTIPMALGVQRTYLLSSCVLSTAIVFMSVLLFSPDSPLRLTLVIMLLAYGVTLVGLMSRAQAQHATMIVRLLKVGFTLTLVILVLANH